MKDPNAFVESILNKPLRKNISDPIDYDGLLVDRRSVYSLLDFHSRKCSTLNNVQFREQGYPSQVRDAYSAKH
jgi:hypothetical protein